MSERTMIVVTGPCSWSDEDGAWTPRGLFHDTEQGIADAVVCAYGSLDYGGQESCIERWWIGKPFSQQGIATLLVHDDYLMETVVVDALHGDGMNSIIVETLERLNKEQPK